MTCRYAFTILPALAAALIAGTPVSADPARTHDAGRAAGAAALGLDGDRDGRLSPAEIERGAGGVFASADADGDGRVDSAEMVDWRFGLRDIAAHRGRLEGHGVAMATAHDLFDRDDDGAVTRREMSQAFAFSATYADTDDDGMLSFDEFERGFILSILIRNALSGAQSVATLRE